LSVCFVRIVWFSALASVASVSATTIGVSNFPKSATIITFDDVPGGNCSLCGPSITTQYSGLGVTFNNPTFPGQETADTNLTFGIPNASAPNALYVDQGGHIGDPTALPFQILFSIPVTIVGFDYASSTDSFLQLDAYGSNNVLLESAMFFGQPTATGLGGFAGLSENMQIVRLDVSYHPSGDPSRTFNFSIDNLEFAAQSVPEPSTIALVGLAFAPILWRRWRTLLKPRAARDRCVGTPSRPR